MPDTAVEPWRLALAKFWAPVPWMLEAATVVQLLLRVYVEAAVIAGLLVFNTGLGFFQEGRAKATLAALKSRLALTVETITGNGSASIPSTDW
jgi:H+-transporting ATPase